MDKKELDEKPQSEPAFLLTTDEYIAGLLIENMCFYLKDLPWLCKAKWVKIRYLFPIIKTKVNTH